MTKPTGKPRGRPKTKAYATLMARIPQELVDQVARYAGLHHQPISVVIREGLLLLLESDPYGYLVSDMKEVPPETEIVYDRKEVEENMSDMKAVEQKIVSDKNGVAPEITPLNYFELHSTMPT